MLKSLEFKNNILKSLVKLFLGLSCSLYKIYIKSLQN